MPIPDVLYHYTTQAGLLGIIQSKQIWATSVLFLNDTTEINYAIKLIQENTNKFCEERKLNQEETQFLEDFEKKLDEYSTILIIKKMVGCTLVHFLRMATN